jgi:glycosyltransferase involved in cell wall biosynthesis
MKHAAIYDPYLDTLGGGERYCLTLAGIFRDLGWQVDIIWAGEPDILKKAASLFNLNPTGMTIVKSLSGSKYDLLFWVSDGSIPYPKAKVNWLHFQVPFHDVNGRSFANRFKLRRFKRVIVNSNFTKNVIDKEYAVKSQLIYPPVDVVKFKPLPKKNYILYVGRFSNLMQEKRQDLAVEEFKKFSEFISNDWSLILAGGTTIGTEQKELATLQAKSRGFPIKFVFNPTDRELAKLYGEATLYWATNGFGQDEVAHPEKVEHFGITLVEAMSAGAIPLVVNLGGFPEILSDDLSLFLWNTPTELQIKTLDLVNSPSRRKDWQKKVRRRSLDFSAQKFKIAITKALNDDFS